MNETKLDEAEYHLRFNRTGDYLMHIAAKLHEGLMPHDVSGLFFAVGIENLRQTQKDVDVVSYIRDLADGVEKHEIGIRPPADKAN